MNIEQIRDFCINKKGVSEEFPFDEETLVFKVMGKMFALASLEKIPLQINLKCDPEKAIELREKYESVQPGYHMNKKHWNTVQFESDLDEGFLCELVDHSYDMVIKKLRKADREFLESME